MLSKIWYCMQIPPILEEASTLQVNSLVVWFKGQEKYSGYPSRLCIYSRQEVRRSSTYSPSTMCSFSVDAGNNCKPKTRWPLDGSNSGKYISTSVNHRIWELFPHDFREMLHDDHSPTHHRKRLQYIHIHTSMGGKTRRSQNVDIPTGPIHRVVTGLEEPPQCSNQWRNPLHMLSHDTWPYTDADPPVSNPSRPLPNVPAATPDNLLHPFTECKETTDIWRWAWAEWPSSSAQTSVTSLPPRHVAAFSQYVNMAQPQTRSHLVSIIWSILSSTIKRQ